MRLRDLRECGLGKNPKELYLAYLGKVGAHASEEIRRDRRMRPDSAGATTLQGPETWEEAHEVFVESEKLRRGTSAYRRYAGAVKHGGGPDHVQHSHDTGGAKGDGKRLN